MPLRDHLRAEQDGRAGLREPPQACGKLLRLGGRVGIEADQLELGQLALELALELLRPGAEACEVGRPADAAVRRLGLRVAAVVAAQRSAAVENERDVAVRAA